jgi:hypothetical protein
MTLADMFTRWPLHTMWSDGDYPIRVVGYRHHLGTDTWRLLVEHPGQHDPHWVLAAIALTWAETS